VEGASQKSDVTDRCTSAHVLVQMGSDVP
jgi:hypothetical protein